MENEIARAVEMLRKGRVILYPTDTVWGMGCDATQSKAVQKVYQIKGRPKEKSAIVLLESIDKIERYVKKVPPIAYDLIRVAPGPLTIIYEGGKNVAKNVLGQDGSIAIRVVTGDFCVEIIRRLKKPVVSTSANYSGEPTPLIFDEISDTIKSGVDHIVNIYQDRVKAIKPSTIIKLELNNRFTVLRS